MLSAGRYNGSLMFIAFDRSDGVEKWNIPLLIEEGSAPIRSIISPLTWNHIISTEIWWQSPTWVAVILNDLEVLSAIVRMSDKRCQVAFLNPIQHDFHNLYYLPGLPHFATPFCPNRIWVFQCTEQSLWILTAGIPKCWRGVWLGAKSGLEPKTENHNGKEKVISSHAGYLP